MPTPARTAAEVAAPETPARAFASDPPRESDRTPARWSVVRDCSSSCTPGSHSLVIVVCGTHAGTWGYLRFDYLEHKLIHNHGYALFSLGLPLDKSGSWYV